MATPFIRVLVVDDYEPFRRFVCSTLGQISRVQIIGEASDGLEAVQKAEQLQPDLIILDIDLPTLNGIEIARRTPKLSSKSKILFVSQESSADVVEEALRLGALGYVVKTHAASDLLAAVEEVCHGRQFIGSGVSDGHFSDSTDAQAARGNEHTHVVQFYKDDNFWSDNVSEYLCTALSEGKSAIVCATGFHVAAVHESIQAHIDVRGLEKVGRFIALDAEETLSKFMNSDLPDQRKFASLLGSAIRDAEAAAIAKNNPVVIVGEMVALLMAAGKIDATIRLAQLWNDLATTHSFRLLLAYPSN